MGVARYKGKFGAREAERLLWRAGFGPAPGEIEKLARKDLLAEVVARDALSTDADAPNSGETPKQALDRALGYWSHPRLSAGTQIELLRFGTQAVAANSVDWEDGAYEGLRQNALRLLIASAPDRQVS